MIDSLDNKFRGSILSTSIDTIHVVTRCGKIRNCIQRGREAHIMRQNVRGAGNEMVKLKSVLEDLTRKLIQLPSRMNTFLARWKLNFVLGLYVRWLYVVIQFLLTGRYTRARHLFYKNMPRVLIYMEEACELSPYKYSSSILAEFSKRSSLFDWKTLGDAMKNV